LIKLEASAASGEAEKEVKSFCQAHIANYKVPKYVEFVTDILLAGVGKIQKFKLDEQAKAELEKRKKSE